MALYEQVLFNQILNRGTFSALIKQFEEGGPTP